MNVRLVSPLPTVFPLCECSRFQYLFAALSEMAPPTKWDDLPPFTTPDQLSEDLVTLSLMPRSKWQTLLNLETIKVRLRPPSSLRSPD